MEQKTYHCWTANTPQDKALAAYKQRYGQEPKEITTQYGMLWLGPVPTAADHASPPLAIIASSNDVEEPEQLELAL